MEKYQIFTRQNKFNKCSRRIATKRLLRWRVEKLAQRDISDWRNLCHDCFRISRRHQSLVFRYSERELETTTGRFSRFRRCYMTRVTAVGAPERFLCSNNVALTAVYVPALLSPSWYRLLTIGTGKTATRPEVAAFRLARKNVRGSHLFLRSTFLRRSLRLSRWNSSYSLSWHVHVHFHSVICEGKSMCDVTHTKYENNWRQLYPNRSSNDISYQTSIIHELHEYLKTSNWFFALKIFASSLCLYVSILSSWNDLFAFSLFMFSFLLPARLPPVSSPSVSLFSPFSSFNFFSDLHTAHFYITGSWILHQAAHTRFTKKFIG